MSLTTMCGLIILASALLNARFAAALWDEACELRTVSDLGIAIFAIKSLAVFSIATAAISIALLTGYIKIG